jgi:hypothetical protein
MAAGMGAQAASPTPAGAATRLLVADVRALSLDEQILFAALEGIVNRSSPHLYLEGLRYAQDFDLDPTAATWLHDTVPLGARTVAPYDFLMRYRSRVRGLVVWDPRLAVDTQNVATTIAGVEDVLPASPAVAARLGRAPYRLPIVFDLRREAFASRAQAYDWALQRFGCCKRTHMLAWLGGARNGRAGQPGLRDLLVAQRAFAFEADPEREPDLATRILDSFPSGTPVFGYPFFDDQLYAATGQAAGEPLGIGEISRSGKWLIPSADATNLTVHGYFKPIVQHPPWDDRPAPADPAKTYVAFLLTDGDNLGYNEQGLRTLHWDDPARGSIPMGISISPWLAVYAPRIYDFYVHSLTPNDVLVVGPSGAGYAYPQFESDLGGYLASTRKLMSLSGLRAVWILDNGYLASPSPLIVQQYVAALHPAAIFADYGGWAAPNPPPVSFSGGVPVVHALWGPDVASTVAKVRLAAAAFPGHPAFVLVALSTWSMGYSQARAVMQGLGPAFEAVRPDRFVGLVRAAYGAYAGFGGGVAELGAPVLARSRRDAPVPRSSASG